MNTNTLGTILTLCVGFIPDMYNGNTSRVRCAAGQSQPFEVEVSVHQGSELSPVLFNLVLNYLTNDIMDELL